jgi:hypothetical protein
MRKRTCPSEKDVMEGLRRRALTPELQKHAAECPVCKDVAAAHAWMARFKEKAWKIDMPEKVLPDAQAVWDGAFVGRKPDTRLVKKALRPLLIPQVMSFGVFVAGSIFLGAKGTFRLGHIFDSPALARIFPFFLALTSMVLLSAVLCGLLLVFEKRKRPI